MAELPVLIPRDWLSDPDGFGADGDVEWQLAGDIGAAAQLARSIQPHHLTGKVRTELRRRDMSMDALGGHLDRRPETVGAKLAGHRPATSEDIYWWCWFTDTRTLRIPSASELLEDLADALAMTR